MRISVVMPVFQRQDSGGRALRSALAQGIDGLEVVVVDDGSDPAFAIPDDLARDPRVRLVRQARNAGAAAARNRGVREASGEWIAFLDSDDLWLAGKLPAQLHVAAHAPPLTCVVTGYRRIETATGAARELVPIASRDPADFACGCWFSPGSTALVPRAAFAAVGPFDETLERLEDLDWYLRAALAGGGIAVAPVIGATINVGTRAPYARVSRAIAQLRRKWLAAPGGSGPALVRRVARNLEASLALEQAAACYFDGRYGTFAWHLLRSLIARPRMHLYLRRWWTAPGSVSGHPPAPAA
jgi:glycosyltransferase involved in cell wall biosynthesis